MAQFPGITLTNAGLNLIAESQASSTALIFTNLKMGDGTLTTGEDVKVLTAVKNPMLTVPPESYTNSGSGQVRLRFAISNGALETGFFARELGIYAKVGAAGTEQLYAYTNAGNLTDYIPDKNTPIDEQIIDIYLVVGNASRVAIVSDGSIIYVSKAEFDDHKAATDAHSLMMQFWQPEYIYAVGDCIRPKIHGSYKEFECTVGGKSGTTEPTWGDVGSAVTDGGVTWVVRDRRVANARFDNSAKIATSNFVKAAGLRFSAMGSIIATSTLDNTYAGKLLQLYSASAFTVTLPPASTVPSGETIAFVNRNSGIATIAAAGTDALAMGTANLSTIAVKNGETLTIVSNGADAWFVAGSTAHLGKIEGFGSLLEASGYQKLPSGWIIQWMTVTTGANGEFTATFPIAFPSGRLSEAVGLVSGNYVVQAIGGSTSNRRGVAVSASTGSPATAGIQFQYITIGK